MVSLLAGESGAGEITQFDHTDYTVHFACEVKDLDPTDWMDRKDARRMDRFTHLILAAARQAERRLRARHREGGRPHRRLDRDRHRRPAARSRSATTRCSTRGPDRVNPFSIPSIIPNLGAGWVSIELGTRGPLHVGVHGVRGVEHGDRRRAPTRSGSAAPT